MMTEIRMNKKTNFPDLERLAKTNFWKHLLNYWWNRPRVLFEDIHEKYILKPKEKDKYSFVMFIDPEVTKDSKTKNVKEITIQFIFFDYKEYKKNES